MSKTSVLIIILLAFALFGSAQNTKDGAKGTLQRAPCDAAATQSDLNQCAGDDFQKADARLNRIYANLLKQMEGPAGQKLKAAERAWIQYRDLHCEAARYEYEGGSMSPMVFAQCMATTTEHRIEDLKAAYDERQLE
jgi:uncharacterized protein YecT (DUF1311 family)